VFSTFSDQNIVAEHMKQLGLSLGFMAAVANVCAASTLNGWLSGIIQIDPAKARVLVQTARQLKRIADAHRPFRLEYRNADEWRQLLHDWRESEGELEQVEVQAEQGNQVAN